MTPAPIKSTVSRAALDALDVRVGTILKVEDVPGSAKLMRLIVSFGDHTRTILAGLKKERANAVELQGRQALFVVNLEPRPMAGELSEGMPSTQCAFGLGRSQELGGGQPSHQIREIGEEIDALPLWITSVLTKSRHR